MLEGIEPRNWSSCTMDVLKEIWALISESSGYISILFIKIIASKGGKSADYLPNFGIFKFEMVGVRFYAGFLGWEFLKPVIVGCTQCFLTTVFSICLQAMKILSKKKLKRKGGIFGEYYWHTKDILPIQYITNTNEKQYWDTQGLGIRGAQSYYGPEGSGAPFLLTQR